MTPIDLAPPSRTPTIDERGGIVARAAGAVGVALVALLLVAPVLLVGVVPTQDGPVHLAIAEVIARDGWGGTLTGPAAEFLTWNPRVEPNLGAYVVLAGLITLTGDPLTALSGFFLVYVALWLGAVAALVRVVRFPRPVALFVLIAPLVFSKPIHSGFFNYALGLPLSLLFLALVLGLARAPIVMRLVAVALGLLVLALTHITAFGAGLAILAAHGLAEGVGAARLVGGRMATRLVARRALEALIAAVPAGILVGGFLVATADASTDAPHAVSSFLVVVRRLLTAGYLYSFSIWEAVALAPAALALAVGLTLGARWLLTGRVGSADFVTVVTTLLFLALVVVVSLLDLRSGHGVSLSQRLAPLTYLAVAVLVALMLPAGRVGSALIALGFVALVGQTALRIQAYQSAQPTLQAIVDAGRSLPGRTFVSVDLDTLDWAPTDWRVRPHLHAAQLAAAVSGGVGLSSRLLSTRYYGYFPLIYPSDRDFMRATRDFEIAPKDPDGLARFGAAHSGHPGAVLLIGEADGFPLDAFGGQACRRVGQAEPAVRVCAP